MKETKKNELQNPASGGVLNPLVGDKIFKFKDREFKLGIKTHLMGILNVTPDSFSDGNSFIDSEKAVEHAIEMHETGASIIDIGGESTRPGAPKVSLDEELKRVIPILTKIKSFDSNIIVSIDTTKSEVAEIALSEGADIINDVSGLQYDPKIAEVASRHKAGLILMHMRGTPKSMNSLRDYDNLFSEIITFLESAANQAITLGVNPDSIMVDPGIGFAKDSKQNIKIIKNIDYFMKMKYPILVGASRKRFIGDILDESDPKKRNWGTAAVTAYLAMQCVPFIRVHDVKEMRQIVDVISKLNPIVGLKE